MSGFTFVRNAIIFNYPVVESINSILPIVDEFVVGLGNSSDETESLVRSIKSPKIKIVHSTWDETLREGGKVLASETNKALAQVDPASDWAFYLQADEVVHENDLEKIVRSAEQYRDMKGVEGLLFKYKHFYGTYDYIGDSRRWYDHEIRIIRNNGNIISYKDAQGFRTKQNQKLKVKRTGAEIWHYGWVRHPQKQQEKLQNFYSLWNGDQYEVPKPDQDALFDFQKDADSLVLFTAKHPEVMKKRIAEMNWEIKLNPKKKQLSLKESLLYKLEKLTGRRPFNYKNYKII